MGIKVTYNEAALRRLRSRIEAMQRRARDVSPAWNELLDWFAERNSRQFVTRGGEYATPWAPLAEATVREKLREGWPLDPLVRTTQLRQSITRRPLNVEHVTARSVTGGTRNQKAVWQHYGTHRRGRRHIPPRPLFSAAQIKASHVATYAVANWIIDGKRSVRPRRTSVRVH